MSKDYKTKSAAEQFIRKGGACYYRHGLAYRGASRRPLSKEGALRMLPNYDYGCCFYVLDWIVVDGKIALEFIDLSAYDIY